MKFIPLSLLLFSAAASASTCVIENPCDQANAQAEALSLWKKRIDGHSPSPDSAITPLESGMCRLDAKSLLPARASKVVDTTARISGPNCVNTALTLNDSLSFQGEDTFRLVHFEEAALWFRSPYCRVLEADEEMTPGDLWWIRRYDPTASKENYEGTPIEGETKLIREVTKPGIWDDNEMDVHVFTHISDTLSFSKDGFGMQYEYRLVAPQKIFEIFKSPPRCTGFRSNQAPSGCPIRTYRVRCEAQPFKPRLIATSALLQKSVDLISKVQTEISLKALLGTTREDYKAFAARVMPEVRTLRAQLARAIAREPAGELKTALTFMLATTHSLNFQLTGIIPN